MMDERQLDRALRAWAGSDLLPGAGDKAALGRILDHADALSMHATAGTATGRHRGWWFGGLTALAASVAVVAITTAGLDRTGIAAGDGISPQILADAELDDGPVFALLYTPTNEEEYQL